MIALEAIRKRNLHVKLYPELYQNVAIADILQRVPRHLGGHLRVENEPLRQANPMA